MGSIPITRSEPAAAHGADDIWLRKQDCAKIRFDGAYRAECELFELGEREVRSSNRSDIECPGPAQKQYSAAIWKQRTGKSVEALGEKWKAAKRPEA